VTTAFVAGATGYTGREVVHQLRAMGIETVAHVRPDSSRLAEWRTRFESLGAKVDTTAWDPAAMAATMRALRPDLVFALLGTTRSRAREARQHRGRDEGYEAVDYGLTMLLYAAAVESGGRPRFVYLSAIGVREEGGNAYLAARARVERALRSGPLPWTIARPSFITGPDREEFRLGERLGAIVIDGLLAVAGWFGGKRLRDRYRSTTNVALARALVWLGFDPGSAGRTVESEELRQP
jgi:nucleoside-diphosphate-sugar epimerase